MAYKISNKGLKRSALSVALGMCFASSLVLAQSSVGSVFGSAKAGATVTIENTGTGAKRDLTADDSGRFSFVQLAPGTYKVTADGATREVSVRVGSGTQVNFATQDAASFGEVTVVGTGSVNPIDVSSVESTSIFTAEQLQRLPVARDVSSVALLAPGTVKGDTGFGNLVSFGGSSVAENGYYVNGFDVTNLRFMLSFADLPYEALAEQQTKTGGYGAEFGRSLGGVISVITKSGTNDWEYGASLIYSPEWGREHGKDVVSKDPDDISAGTYLLRYRSNNSVSDLRYNIYAGGPIIKDRLFFFALASGKDTETNQYTLENSFLVNNDSPSGLVKLNWNITDDHTFEVTAIYNEDTAKNLDYANDDGLYYQSEHQNQIADYSVLNGGEIYVGKYTGYLTDNFTISAQTGRLKSFNSALDPSILPGGECVAAYDSRANRSDLLYTGCWNLAQFSIQDQAFGPETDVRLAHRIDAEWRLGNHNIRFGADKETFTSGKAGLTRSGGIYWRHFFNYDAAPRTVNGVAVPVGASYARSRVFNSSSGGYAVENTAYYLEDNWQVNDNVLVYGGLRTEGFKNLNASGEVFIEAANNIAPRMGISWDVNGDGSVKLFANAGRYFIPVASNTNIRGSGAEATVEKFFYTTGLDEATGLPTGLGAQIGATGVNGSLTPPNPATVSATNLAPMYQDEFIAGMQNAISDIWTIGAKVVYRSVKAGMDDYCSVQPFVDWAADNGYDNFDYHSLATCFVMNPGRDSGIAMDLEDDGNLVNVVIPESYFGLPKYLRNYKALEFSWERTTDKVYFAGSYTWSKSYGNVEGYVNSSLEQGDPGLTQDFDHAAFEAGSYGYLPNDHRHVFKAFGNYKINDEWDVGSNMVVSSGRPVNCLGFVGPVDNVADNGSLNQYGPSSFYCKTGPGDDDIELRNRGSEGRTPWTWNLDAKVTYKPAMADGKLALTFDVFNVFNNAKVTEYNETSAAGTRADQSQDLNFLNDVNYQTPRSIRFSARYDF